MSEQAVYTLDEFRSAHSLPRDEAERIFRLSGPSKVNLDVFMRVYKKPGAAEDLFFAPNR